MFERFTEPARQVIVNSQTIAAALGAEEITSDHLRLALPETGKTIPFSEDAKKAMELSLREALRAGVDYVAPIHIRSALDIKPNQQELLDLLANLKALKEQAIVNQKFSLASLLRQEEVEINKELGLDDAA